MNNLSNLIYKNSHVYNRILHAIRYRLVDSIFFEKLPPKKEATWYYKSFTDYMYSINLKDFKKIKILLPEFYLFL